MALITLAIIGWFSLQRNRSTEEDDQLVSHSRDVLEASGLLRSHISNAAAARRAYTIGGDSKKIDAFSLASKSTMADFAALRKLTTDGTEQQLSLTQMEPLINARLSLLKESVELQQRGGDNRKQQDAFTDQSARLSAQFTELIDEFDRAERAALRGLMPICSTRAHGAPARAARASKESGANTTISPGATGFSGAVVFMLYPLAGDLLQ